MSDDDDPHGEHSARTVPPPPGETNIYEAKTRVGGLSEEALSTLLHVGESQPPPQAHIPVGPAGPVVAAAVAPPAARTPVPASIPAPKRGIVGRLFALAFVALAAGVVAFVVRHGGVAYLKQLLQQLQSS